MQKLRYILKLIEDWVFHRYVFRYKCASFDFKVNVNCEVKFMILASQPGVVRKGYSAPSNHCEKHWRHQTSLARATPLCKWYIVLPVLTINRLVAVPVERMNSTAEMLINASVLLAFATSPLTAKTDLTNLTVQTQMVLYAAELTLFVARAASNI